MQIINDVQYRIMRFVAAANRGGNRPETLDVLAWINSPLPRRAMQGPLIRPGKPAKYRTVGGLANSEAFLETVTAMSKLSSVLKSVEFSFVPAMRDALMPYMGTRELIEEAIPAEYGPDVPPESSIEHLIRLRWLDKDERNGLGLTALGRALLRNHDVEEDESDGFDVVVLDANSELSYPLLVKKIAEMDAPLLIDPYLRVEQLLAVRAYTTVSRVLISANLKQEDRVAMAVLVESGTGQSIEIRVADKGVLHDRMIVGDDSVITIGTSINTVGRQYPTVLTPLPETVADTMRDYAETWWKDASVLANSE